MEIEKEELTLQMQQAVVVYACLVESVIFRGPIENRQNPK